MLRVENGRCSGRRTRDEVPPGRRGALCHAPGTRSPPPTATVQGREGVAALPRGVLGVLRPNTCLLGTRGPCKPPAPLCVACADQSDEATAQWAIAFQQTVVTIE